jgi:hypothetical protein
MLIQRQATKVATISAIALALLSPCAAQADLYVIEQNGFINNSGTPINLYTWQIQSAGNRGIDPASFLGLQNKPNAFLGIQQRCFGNKAGDAPHTLVNL